MRRALVGSVLVLLAVGFGPASGPASQPAIVRYGAVAVRKDAPPEIHDYFKLIPTAIGWWSGAKKEAEDELALKRRLLGPRGMREHAVEIDQIKSQIEFASARLTEAESKSFRPTSTNLAPLCTSGNVCVPKRIHVIQVFDETTALIEFNINGTSQGGKTYQNGVWEGVVTNWPTTDIIDDQFLERSFRLVKSGTYRYETASGAQRTVVKFVPLPNVEPFVVPN